MSDVPRSLPIWVSTIQSVVLTADVFQLLNKIYVDRDMSYVYPNTSSACVSCEYDPKTPASWDTTVVWPHAIRNWVPVRSIMLAICLTAASPWPRKGHTDVFLFSFGIEHNPIGMCCAACYCLMYHAACKVEFQPFKRSYSQLTFFNFLLKKRK